MSYDYNENQIISNDKVSYRIKQSLLRDIEPKHERIESVKVEDYEIYPHN